MSKVEDAVKTILAFDLSVDSIYEIKGTKKDVALLLVLRGTSEGSFVPTFNGDEITVEIHPNDLKKLKGEIEKDPDDTLEMPKGWKIGKLLYDGDLVYTDLNKMILDINDFPYQVETDDLVSVKRVGFKCSGEKFKRSKPFG